MDANISTIDPVALVRSLDPKVISQRLDELDREREALRVLMRAALRAERAKDAKAAPDGGQAR